jgi:arabinose-5-phosphate isomerase
LIIADLLAVAVAELRGIGSDGLNASHPHGLIGTALQRTVRSVMHAAAALPVVHTGTILAQALAEMTSKSLGCVGVINANSELLGFLTDGDVRRALERQVDVSSASADSIMSASPVTIHPDAKLLEALQLMERRERQIGVLPVVEEGRFVGVIRLHDIVRLQV